MITDVFQVQAEIAGEVAQALDVALGRPEREQLEEQAHPEPRRLRRLPARRGSLQAHGRDRAAGAGAGRRRLRARGRARLGLRTGLGSAVPGALQPLCQRSPDARRAPRERARPRAGARPRPRRRRGETGAGNVLRLRHRRVRQGPASSSPWAAGPTPNNAELLSAAALSEQSLGRWEDALDFLKRAEVSTRGLPRSSPPGPKPTSGSAGTDEAVAAATAVSRSRRAASRFTRPRRWRCLAQGDLRGRPRRAPCGSSHSRSDRTGRLDRQLLGPGLGPGRRAAAAAAPAGPLRPSAATASAGRSSEAQTYAYRGDLRRARVYADSARPRLGRRPGQHTRTTRSAASCSAWPWPTRAGRRRRSAKGSEAWRCCRSPRTRSPVRTSSISSRRIYILTGEARRRPLDLLEPLLEFPYYLSPGWLRVDPTFDPLRKHPRFRKLVEGTA